MKELREADTEFVLLDGTLAECDRVGDRRAGYSAKHRRHGVDVQVVTDPDGHLPFACACGRQGQGRGGGGPDNGHRCRTSRPTRRGRTEVQLAGRQYAIDDIGVLFPGLDVVRAHRIIHIGERQGGPVPAADRALTGAGPWVTTLLPRLPGRGLSPTRRTFELALSVARGADPPGLTVWR